MNPLHVFYLRADQHQQQSVRELLASLHLDELWLRLTPVPEVSWEGAGCLMLELHHLLEGNPVLPETLASELSREQKVALRLSVDASRTSFAYQLFQDGAAKLQWAGNVAEKQAAELPIADRRADPERRSALQEQFLADTGLELDALLSSAAVDPVSSELALPGTEVLVRGRFVQLVAEMGRWPEMFRFHDRNFPPLPGEEPDGERLALLGLDRAALEALWRRTPSNQVLQFLRLMEPLKGKVLGPLSGALPEALTFAEGAPPDAPLAAAPEADLNTYEVLAVSSALVFMVGDRIGYLDQRFFPLLGLQAGEITSQVIADSLEDIDELGVLSAMTEVLPYSVPEGELLEAVADEELAPLASWAAGEGLYEGSLFLLDVERLAAQVAGFDLQQLRRQTDSFLEAWFPLADPTAADIGEWLAARHDLDAAEWARFEDTFVEFKHLLALCALNRLTPALLFYGS